jgi:hypothetical protein
VCGDLEPLYALLDRFELGVAHDTWRGRSQFSPQVPTAFAELNTGMIAYRLTPSVKGLVGAWVERFDEMRADHGAEVNDQAAFRVLLWESEVRFVIVPAEYNFRIWCPNALGTFSEVALLHSHETDLARIAALVNESLEPRVVLPTIGHLDPTKTIVLTPRGNRALGVLGRVWRLLGRRPHSWSGRA